MSLQKLTTDIQPLLNRLSKCAPVEVYDQEVLLKRISRLYLEAAPRLGVVGPASGTWAKAIKALNLAHRGATNGERVGAYLAFLRLAEIAFAVPQKYRHEGFLKTTANPSNVQRYEAERKQFEPLLNLLTNMFPKVSFWISDVVDDRGFDANQRVMLNPRTAQELTGLPPTKLYAKIGVLAAKAQVAELTAGKLTVDPETVLAAVVGGFSLWLEATDRRLNPEPGTVRVPRSKPVVNVPRAPRPAVAGPNPFRDGTKFHEIFSRLLAGEANFTALFAGVGAGDPSRMFNVICEKGRKSGAFELAKDRKGNIDFRLT